MAAERHYTLTHFDGATGLAEPFTALGLEDTLNMLQAMCGGKLHKPASVSPALSLGGGAALLAVEAGRVIISRDDKAAKISKQAEDVETVDGRKRKFKATVAVGRLVNASNKTYELQGEIAVIGDGLVDVFFQAAMYLQETLGDVPQAMQWQEVERRLPAVRAQLSRAKAQSREATTVRFPNSDAEARFFELPSRPNEYYTVAVSIETAEPVDGTPTIIRR